MRSIIGQSIGRYHILEQLGEGGMAIVYKAYDTHLECEVAVKIIRTENIPPKLLDHALKRFARESKVLVQLDHPNIVRVTDVGEFEGIPWLVMPLLSGGTLKKKMKTHGRYQWQDALRILIPVADALAYTHSKKVVHRDIKPSNLLFTKDGTPKVSDFGIAKILEAADNVELTGTSAAVGTPEYMAPEQITSKNIDSRADIYSLGIVLYEMITGKRPFEAVTPMAVMIQHAHDPLPRPSKIVTDLPDSVEYLLIKALAKQPEDRFASMGDFSAAMQALLVNPQTAAYAVEDDAQDTLQTMDDLETSDSFQSNAEPPKIPPLLPQSNPDSFPKRKSKAWLFVLAGLAVVAILILVFVRPMRNTHTAAPVEETTPISQSGGSVPTQTAHEISTPSETVQAIIMLTPSSTHLSICDVNSFIQEGDFVRVSIGGGRNGIRSTPDTTPSDNQIGVAESGQVLRVISSPECDRGGYLLWYVIPTYNTDWSSGWTPEIAEPVGEYWLEPLPYWQPCNNTLASHLQPGDEAFVSVINDTSNKVRATPALNGEDIGRIKPGETLSIIDGPVCEDDFIWWNVRSEKGLTGWTVEGQADDFWLIPIYR